MKTNQVRSIGWREWATTLLGFAALLLAAQWCGAATVLYSTGFEASEGFTNRLRLDGQNGWTSAGSGSNGIVSGVFAGLGQQAYIGWPAANASRGGLTLWKPINANPLTNGAPVVTFSTLMSIAASTNGQTDYFDWSVFNKQGDRLFTLDFDNYSGEISYALDGEGTYVPTGILFSNQLPYQLQMTMDFSRNRWGATLGSIVVVDDQPMTTTNAPLNLGDVDAVRAIYDTNAPGNNFMVFDNYRLSSETAPPPRPAATVVYATGFDSNEGYTNGLALDQQQGWRSFGSGSNAIVSGFFAGLGQQVYVGYPAADQSQGGIDVWQPLNYDPLAAGKPLVTFSVLMGIEASTNGQSDYFDWIIYNSQGNRLFTLDFDNTALQVNYQLDGTNRFTSANVGFTDELPYLLSVAMDFSRNRWNASLGGALIITNQPITTTKAPLNLGDVDAMWAIGDTNAPGDNYMLFDRYQITAQSRSSAPPPPRLMLSSRLADGSTLLRLSGQTNMSFAIEASTNLTAWTSLKTNITTSGFFDFTDPGATGLTSRFYRGRWVP